jgi:hypothetical protein
VHIIDHAAASAVRSVAEKIRRTGDITHQPAWKPAVGDPCDPGKPAARHAGGQPAHVSAIGQVGDVRDATDVDDRDMAITLQPPAGTIQDRRGTRNLRRRASFGGISVVVLVVAWLFNPVLGGVFTLVASVVLSAVLAPDRIDGRGVGGDFRNDAGPYL